MSKTHSKLEIDVALSRFLAQLEANGRSSHTVAQYRRHVRVLIRWLSAGDLCVDVQRVTHEILATFLATPQVQRPTPGPHATLPRNLIACGDWTDTGLPSTLEGAALSAHLALTSTNNGANRPAALAHPGN